MLLTRVPMSPCHDGGSTSSTAGDHFSFQDLTACSWGSAFLDYRLQGFLFLFLFSFAEGESEGARLLCFRDPLFRAMVTLTQEGSATASKGPG